MELPHLDSFLAVYRAGTVTAAAATLGLSQPAVSAHLSALEGVLGRPLFVRRARGVLPTSLADALAAEVSGPLDALHAVVDGFGQDADPFEGTLLLAGPADLLALVALPALAPLVRRGLRVRVRSEHGPGLIARVAAGEVDLALIGRPSRSRSVAVRPLLDEELLLVGAAALGPIGGDVPAALAGLPMLAFDQGSPLTRRYYRYQFPAAELPAPRVVVEDLRALHGLVAAGAGWTVLPDYLAAGGLARGEFRLLHEPAEAPINTLYTAVRAGRADQPMIRAVLRRLHTAVRRPGRA